MISYSNNNLNIFYKPICNTPYVLTFSPSLPKDVQLYIELVKNGQLYEHLMQHFGIDKSKRDEFKTEFFSRIFYSKINHNWQHEYAKKFNLYFPSVYEAVIHYKQGGHSKLPIMLQTIESDLMINKVSNRLLNELGNNVFLLTLHDSIICLENDGEKIKQIMIKEVKNEFGYLPPVKVSNFN